VGGLWIFSGIAHSYLLPLQVERIKLSHDHMEYGTGFHVKEVEIDVPSYGNHYTFPCNSWLAQDELTEMTVKDLNSSTPAPSKAKFSQWVWRKYSLYKVGVGVRGEGSAYKRYLSRLQV